MANWVEINAEIKAGDFTLWLRCDGLDRAAAGQVAFVLQYWSLWGKLPKQEDVIRACCRVI